MNRHIQRSMGYVCLVVMGYFTLADSAADDPPPDTGVQAVCNGGVSYAVTENSCGKSGTLSIGKPGYYYYVCADSSLGLPDAVYDPAPLDSGGTDIRWSISDNDRLCTAKGTKDESTLLLDCGTCTATLRKK